MTMATIDPPTSDVALLREQIAMRLRVRRARKLGLTPIAFEHLRRYQYTCIAALTAPDLD